MSVWPTASQTRTPGRARRTPGRDITIDRDSGEAYVFKMVDGSPVRQQVELGLRNERESQILAGLQDGDVLAFVTQSSEEQLRGALFGGGN